jgi:hypothetical protein
MSWDALPLRASLAALLCVGCPQPTKKVFPDAALPPVADRTVGEEISYDATSEPLSAPALAIAGDLQGAYLELECLSEEIEFQFCRPKDRGQRQVTLHVGGEVGKKYSFVLGVWGVVEGVTYQNGIKGGDHFYIGGKGNTPGTAQYGLTVGDLTYYLNHFEIGAGEHYTYGISYSTPPIVIPGGATLTLYVDDPDNFVNTNHMQSEADNPPPGLLPHLAAIAKETPPGQFVYLEVLSVSPVP